MRRSLALLVAGLVTVLWSGSATAATGRSSRSPSETQLQMIKRVLDGGRLPGGCRVVQNELRNPVILLLKVDKGSGGWQGSLSEGHARAQTHTDRSGTSTTLIYDYTHTHQFDVWPYLKRTDRTTARITYSSRGISLLELTTYTKGLIRWKKTASVVCK